MSENNALVELTAELVSAYVANNSVPAADLPKLIATICGALAGVSAPQASAAAVPPVNPKRTVFRDYLISLEDGKRYRTLKRHLTGRGLTPEQYRQKWNLPRDYPMVAPAYSAARSDMAKKLGLGQKPAAANSAPTRDRSPKNR